MCLSANLFMPSKRHAHHLLCKWRNTLNSTTTSIINKSIPYCTSTPDGTESTLNAVCVKDDTNVKQPGSSVDNENIPSEINHKHKLTSVQEVDQEISNLFIKDEELGPAELKKGSKKVWFGPYDTEHSMPAAERHPVLDLSDGSSHTPDVPNEQVMNAAGSNLMGCC